MRMRLLKLGTVTQGRVYHRRSLRIALGCAALAHREVREKGAFGTGSQDEPGTSCWLTIALEFRTQVPLGKQVGEGKGNGMGCPLERESALRPWS